MGDAKRQGSRSITLLIVDKEPLVRSELTELCASVSDLRVLGEAESGRDAIEAAASLSPDVMLIDVALPDMSGFDVLRHRGCAGRLGIMTSEQPYLAEQAAAESAVDYLRKPVSICRLAQAIERVRQHYAVKHAVASQAMPQLPRASRQRRPLLIGERQHRLYPLDVEKVDYIEADGNYVTIRVGGDEYLSRNSIKRLSEELAEFDFVRIDRSILLNIRSVYFAEPIGHGMLAFTLTSGACLHSSKRYRDAILQVLPWHHCRAG